MKKLIFQCIFLPPLPPCGHKRYCARFKHQNHLSDLAIKQSKHLSGKVIRQSQHTANYSITSPCHVFVMLVFSGNGSTNYRKPPNERRQSAWERAIAFHTLKQNKEWAKPPC